MKKTIKLKQSYAIFSTEKDAEKCFRLLHELGELSFLYKGYTYGISDKKRKVVYLRELKELVPIDLRRKKWK